MRFHWLVLAPRLGRPNQTMSGMLWRVPKPLPFPPYAVADVGCVLVGPRLPLTAMKRRIAGKQAPVHQSLNDGQAGLLDGISLTDLIPNQFHNFPKADNVIISLRIQVINDLGELRRRKRPHRNVLGSLDIMAVESVIFTPTFTASRARGYGS